MKMLSPFATYNGKTMVLFRTYEEFKPLLQRKTKTYEIKDISVFAKEILLDIVNLHQDKTKWDSRDDAFVKRAKHFHEILSDKYFGALEFELKNNIKFENDFSKWVKEQGFEYKKEETLENFAKQGAYILMNQLLF